ncbi:MAG TPA: efflux RND transporter permease subunit [Spirochaetes bacterium]|nr:efflux RND transporter permease subunit [Spirochaetota bacterium]
MLGSIFRKSTGFILLIVILCSAGGLLVTQLPIQLYPQTRRPRVRAFIFHTGISAIDFSNDYAQDIESQLLSIDGVDIVEVEYENDRSDFTLTFDWKVDSEKAKSDVESKMNSIMDMLPPEYGDSYFVHFFSGENAGYLVMGVTSESSSPEEIYRALKTAVQPRLSRVEDVESIEMFKVEELKAEVVLRQMDMLANGLTIDMIEEALMGGYRPESVGKLEDGNTTYSVRFLRGVESVYDIGSIVVARKGNVSIELQDVADIKIKYALPERAFVMDGARGIRLTATPIDGGNVRQMSSDVQAVLEEAKIDGILPGDTIFHFYLDPAEYINRSIRNVVQAALIGAALAMIVVLLSLGEMRNTLLIGITLPVTLILSFILMYFFKVSLNLISLGGLALAVGMVIDPAIVIMENIHRFRLEESPVKNLGHLKELIIRAVRQVRSPVIASILTSVLVFLPILFTAPLANAILGDQAKTVIFALLISMIVALTLIPLLASLVYKRKTGRAGAKAGVPPRGLPRLSVPVMGFLVNLYKTMLRGLIRRKWAIVGFMLFSFGLLAFSIIRILPLIPREIISPPSSDRLVMYFRSPSINDPDRIVQEVIPDIEARIKDQVGQYVEGTYADVYGRFNRYFINLTSTEHAEEVLGELQKIFVNDNVWYYNVMMWDPAQLPLPRTMDLQISVQGDEPVEIITLLERIRDLVNETEIYSRVFTDPPTNLSDEIAMRSRVEVIDGFGEFSERSLIKMVRKILSGTASIEFEQDQTTVEVAAVYPESRIQGRENLENFLIPYNQSTIPLKHFFDFQEVTGISGFASENGEMIYRLYARMAPGTPAARRSEFEQRIRDEIDAKITVPAGYSMVFDNPQEEMEQAIRSLFIALAGSVVLVYLLLAFQFNSLIIPLVILVTVPLGFIGVVFSLFLFKSSLSLNSMLGTIMLAGIVVNNAIIMIDFYLKIGPNYNRKIDALVETAGIRFTPIVITMLTTVFGMLPIAIGLGEGSNIIQPLGIAVSGGLLISTLFTLFMVPSILSLFNVKIKKP